MNSSTQRELVDKITREFADQGKLIELGWQLLRIMTVPADAPQAQLDEMRMPSLPERRTYTAAS